jgi:hypothetical protein
VNKGIDHKIILGFIGNSLTHIIAEEEKNSLCQYVTGYKTNPNFYLFT